MSDRSPRWLRLVRFVNKRTRNSRLVRRVGIRSYSSILSAIRFLPPPRVLLNGPPKSGTHLLSDCVSLMPKMMYSGRHFALTEYFISSETPHDVATEYLVNHSERRLEEGRLSKFLRRCPPGMFVTAHSRFHPVLQAQLHEYEFKQILLLRDPRDVAISHALYVKREPLHFHHRYFTEVLTSDEERILAVIRGFEPSEERGEGLLSIRESFAGFVPWFDDSSTLVIRFENLVGQRGGGAGNTQLEVIASIGKFVGRTLSEQQIEQIADKMYSTGSLTFRKGQIGDWHDAFTDEHRQAFKDVAGDLLVELSYEQDVNW